MIKAVVRGPEAGAGRYRFSEKSGGGGGAGSYNC